ncbi:imelysin family protein [Arenibaculum pallidiluteum]|uniref:imelysin family protein n=1 Tax=Arenibaculum pallidiluteum TaxID=2812559 RepID=UPI001A966E79|nr:imelysin family protein [Arenibaculum pallidiluteum]
MAKSILLRAAAVLMMMPLGMGAALGADGDGALLRRLAETHAQPRAGALAGAAAGLAERLDRFCAAPSAAGLAEARAGFDAAMDGWMGIQHLRPGPAAMFMRAERMAFWPERNNAVARQLGQILAARDPKALEPQAIARSSVATQGLSALEHLLYAERAEPGAFGGDETGRYRCAYAAAVARNVAGMADGIRADWVALPAEFEAGGPTSVAPTAAGAVEALYGALVTAMQVVVDQKLLAPLGADSASAKPRLAESVRSGRSLRNVALNLAAVRAALLGEGGGPGFVARLPAGPEGNAVRARIAEAFDRAIAAAGKVGAPLDQAVADPKRRPAVLAAFRAAKEAQALVAETLPPLLGISLGFNELDGD